MRLLQPGEAAYEAALAALFHGEAAAASPAAVVQPATQEEVIAALAWARERALPVCVRSGSHSRFCARDGSLVLDASRFLGRITVAEGTVRLGAGATMGAVLEALAPHGLALSVGTHPTPGLGLVLQGGIGHLSRSQGLTLDRIREIHGVRPADGAPFAINAQGWIGPPPPDGGDPARLWTLLRGAAPFLAVVTEVVLEPLPRVPLQVQRALHRLEDLEAVLSTAERLPRGCSCSLVLAHRPDAPGAAALSFAVACDEGGRSALAQLRGNWTAAGAAPALAGPWLLEVAGLEGCPPFDLPRGDGSTPEPPPPASDRRGRDRTQIFSLLLPAGRVAQGLAERLRRAAAAAPNRSCRIDLQHLGGAVAAVPPMASAFAGRSAEWSVVITALWAADDHAMATLAADWAEACFLELEPLACGLYITERHPEASLAERELRLAFGAHLESLRALRGAWDPEGVLPPLLKNACAMGGPEGSS